MRFGFSSLLSELRAYEYSAEFRNTIRVGLERFRLENNPQHGPKGVMVKSCGKVHWTINVLTRIIRLKMARPPHSSG